MCRMSYKSGDKYHLLGQAYNGRAGLAVVCPVTSRVRGYLFEVVLSELEEVSHFD